APGARPGRVRRAGTGERRRVKAPVRSRATARAQRRGAGAGRGRGLVGARHAPRLLARVRGGMLRAGLDMLQRIQIKNYRAIADASVELQPFTVLVGANGSGKSNLLALLAELSRLSMGINTILTRHLRMPEAGSRVDLTTSAGRSAYENAWLAPGKPP